MVRPVVGTFSTESEAEDALGTRLNVMTAVAGTDDAPAPRPPAIGVASVHNFVPYPGAAADTARFALTSVNHKYRLNMTASLLARSQNILERWRNRVAEWSRYPSRPIPDAWRAAVIASLDDDLDVARVMAMMTELENADDIEPGTKFEAFTYVDRIFAVELVRNLGQAPR